MNKAYLDVLGVARQENPHSSFIRWLLDSKSSHALGDYPIKKLVELLIKNKIDITDNKYAKHAFHKNNEDAIAYMKYSNYEISNMGVETEKIIDKGRADIVITFNADINGDNKKVIILIENKVHSRENKNQTQKYEDFLFINSKHDIIFPVFLTVDEKKSPVSNAFNHITYQKLLDNVIEPCYLFCDLPIGKNRIYEYIRCLGQLRGLTEKEKVKSNDVMAISSNEKNMVLSLYNNHDEDIIIEILESINVDNEIKLSEAQCSFWQNYAFALDKSKSNISKKLKRVIVSIIRSARNCYIYTYNNTEYKTKGQHTIGSLFYDIIKKIAERDKWDENTVKEVKEELHKKFNNKSKSWLMDVIILDADIEELGSNNTNTVCKSIEEFADCFYVSDSVKRNQISISNYSEWNKVIIPDESNPESRFYLASYQGSGDVEKMIKLADGNNANSPIKSILEEFKKVEKI